MKAGAGKKKKAAPKPRRESTGARVAKIAGKVLRLFDGFSDKITLNDMVNGYDGPIHELDKISVGDLKALAASCLTQAPDRKGK